MFPIRCQVLVMNLFWGLLCLIHWERKNWSGYSVRSVFGSLFPIICHLECQWIFWGCSCLCWVDWRWLPILWDRKVVYIPAQYFDVLVWWFCNSLSLLCATKVKRGGSTVTSLLKYTSYNKYITYSMEYIIMKIYTMFK